MTILDLITGVLITLGALFFLAGTIGLLRFPDLHARIHSLTKADNLGLGFIVLGLLLQAESVPVASKMILIWLLALAASATSGYLIGNHALEPSDDD